jgi:hypothetical protein
LSIDALGVIHRTYISDDLFWSVGVVDRAVDIEGVVGVAMGGAAVGP